ncbi:hypothetical protein ACVXHB_27630 [Escherichia coli]
MIKLGIVMDPSQTSTSRKIPVSLCCWKHSVVVTNFTIWRLGDLYLINGEARAHTRTLNVKQNYEEWFSRR